MEKRVAKELQKFRDGCESLTATPHEDDLRVWDATITGPVDTPYEGGEFHLLLPLPVEYPFKPPKPQFRTKVYHPNIKADGTMCSAWLDSNWRPNMFLREVLEYTHGILAAPDPDDAIEPEVANLFVQNREEYDRIAKEWTAKYAIPGKGAAPEEEISENTTSAKPDAVKHDQVAENPTDKKRALASTDLATKLEISAMAASLSPQTKKRKQSNSISPNN